ncbi:MAG: alkyl hydroperoxide reductase subunit F [Pseudomonadota bacterium]
MLTKQLLDAVRGYTANMQNDITLVLQTGEHQKRDELKKFLTDFASASDRLHLEERDDAATLRSPVSFTLEVDQKPSGIIFSGIPGGHEFNSLVLAVLHLSGTAPKLDDSIKGIIGAIKQPLNFQTYVSLSCHNCPEVVQTLNAFCTLNENITNEMLDGGLFPDLIEEHNIQGVPTVFLNEQLFANGKIDPAQLLEKLMALYPPDQSSEGSNLEASIAPVETQDISVIGSGPAGVAAAIYAARKGLKVTLIGDRLGGQVKDTMGIENLISVPQTTGPELSDALQVHLNDYELTHREYLKVDKIEPGQPHTLVLSSGERISSRAIIIATGAKWRELGVPGEAENIGNGVAYCPHCDGPFFKGKDVAVIGGGNSGVEAALDLAGIVNHVTVVEFLPELKADQILIDRASERDNIKFIKNAETLEINAEAGKVVSLQYRDRASGETSDVNLSGVFVQIGLVPNSEFAKDLVEMTPWGEIVVDEKCATNQAGIFACGDVTTTPFKQIVVAMGTGSTAALAAYEYLLMADQPAELAAAG